MSNHKRFFTVEEANALIPKLSGIARRIKLLKDEIGSRIPELEPALSKSKINGGHGNSAEYLGKLAEFSECLNAVTEMGCLLKDVDVGLIDFPSMRDGKEVYLCWKLGEDKIRFWHELDAGFAGRNPL